MEDSITPETISEGSQLNPADGGGAVSTGSISLDVLKEALGKEFKDQDTALKSIKDTFSYVGSQAKYRETISRVSAALNTDEQGVLAKLEQLMDTSNEVPAASPTQPQGENFITREQYLEDMFFSKNETLSELKDILTPLKAVHGKDMSWDAFVATDTAKKVVDSYAVSKEVEAKRSVMESNPRLGVATDKLSQARQSMDAARQAEAQGNIAGANQAQAAAREGAVKAVIEAYDLK